MKPEGTVFHEITLQDKAWMDRKFAHQAGYRRSSAGKTHFSGITEGLQKITQQWKNRQSREQAAALDFQFLISYNLFYRSSFQLVSDCITCPL